MKKKSLTPEQRREVVKLMTEIRSEVAGMRTVLERATRR